MIAFLIALALIGAVFFSGLMIELMAGKRMPWSWWFFRYSAALLVVMMLLWPADLSSESRRWRRG